MNTTTQVQSETEATKTVKLVYEGKQLTKYVPKGQSPKLYIDLIKSQVMKPDKNGTPRADSDLLLFLYVAKRTGLDPLTKQIYAVFRWDSRQGKEVMSIQAGIDGMRLVAQRTGDYAGQEEAKMLPEDESTKYPIKATVTIYKMVQGQRVAFTGSARWDEYAPTNAKGEVEFMWRKMPYTMLAKCAEALALRKGFPNELSGVHSEEEMRQALPTESQQIASLPMPTKLKEESTIKVEHGAPTDNSAAPKTVTPDNIDQFANKLNDAENLPTPEPTPTTEPTAQPEVQTPLQTISVEPNIGAMRERLKEMGKEAAAKMEAKDVKGGETATIKETENDQTT